MRRPVPVLFALAATVAGAMRSPAQTMADYARCLRAGGDAAVRDAFVQQAQGTGATGAFAAGCVDNARRRYEDAAKHFEAAAGAAPRSTAAWTMYGTAIANFLPTAGLFAKVRWSPRMRAAFERAIALDAGNLDARYGLLQFHLQAPGIAGGDKARAREQAEAIARVDAWRGAWSRLEVARATNDAGYGTRALTDATVAFPDSSQPWLGLITQQADAGDAAAAFATVERWRQARPGAAAIDFGVGRAASTTGQQLARGETALRSYLVAARRPSDPPVAQAQYRLGLVLQRAGRTDEARLAFREAIRADPGFRPAADALARLD